MREWWSKIRSIFSGRRELARDLADEIESNLDLAADDNQAKGMQREQAHAAARRQFGNTTLIQERAQDTWTFPRFETFAQDLRYGLRGIRRAPGFALVIVLTLALGIGATTAIFSVVDAVLLKPLPFPHAERLVWLGESTGKAEGISVTWANFRSWRGSNRSFDDMAGYQMDRLTLTGREQPLLTRAGEVTSGFFDLVGAKPILGRTFTSEDDRAGAPPAVVLDYGFWIAQFGGDRNILDKTLALNDRAYRVIGVLAPGPQFFPVTVDYYLPLGLFKNDAAPRAQHGSMRVLARLRDGVTLRTARADLDGIMQHLAQQDPGPENDHRVYANFLVRQKTGGVRTPLWLLMGAVGLILLIACANVANLLLARSATRTREIAIRSAIGAGRKRLVRQVLTENLLIAGIGGAVGLLLAQWSLRALLFVAPKGIPRLQETALDSRVLLFTAALTILTGVIVGLAPILTAGKIDLVTALNTGGRSGTDTKKERSFRSVLVVAEITITMVLAFGAGLLLRSLIAAQNTSPGFVPERLLALELALPSSRYKDQQAVQNFYDRLSQQLHSLPGVTSVSLVNCPPFSAHGNCGDWWYSIVGAPAPARGDVPISIYNTADPDYFQTMGIPLREGRAFSAADRKGAPLVAIVNEALARRWWPKESAVGHSIKAGGPYMDGPVYEIVGVAGNVGQEALDVETWPEIYRPFAQGASEAMVAMIRASGDPGSLAPAVRRIVGSMDRNLPIENLRPFEKTIRATLDRRRFSTLLLGIFAGLALVLSAVGIYGLLNYWVTAREEEIAIRLALGAGRSAILGWAGLHALKLVVAGIVFGALGGFGASRWMEALVFGISARDSMMMTTAALAVAGIAAGAAAIPLVRAVRVDAARKLQRA